MSVRSCTHPSIINAIASGISKSAVCLFDIQSLRKEARDPEPDEPDQEQLNENQSGKSWRM